VPLCLLCIGPNWFRMREMDFFYVQCHWFMVISEPEVRSSGRVNNAAFTVSPDSVGVCAYNVVWITVVQDTAN